MSIDVNIHKPFLLSVIELWIKTCIKKTARIWRDYQIWDDCQIRLLLNIESNIHVIVIIAGNGIGAQSSNPGQGCLCFL